MPRDRRHVFLRGWAEAEGYTSYASGGRGRDVPERNPEQHGGKLRSDFERETERAQERRRLTDPEAAATGVYLTFESFPGIELALESLENRRLRRPAELVAVRTERREGEPVQMATVWVPDEGVGNFVRKLEQYISEQTKSGLPRHRNLFDRIDAIRMTTLEALWTEATVAFPAADELFWWEVWLRKTDGNEVERFLTYTEQVDAEVGTRRLAFEDRIVLVVRATAEQLASSVAILDDLAELRQARTPTEFFAGLPPSEQAEWIDDLLSRSTFAGDNAPAVCVLDTGARGGHPLLEPALHGSDIHAVDPDWGTADHDGHGTEMCGLALYGGRLAELLDSPDPAHVEHRLESVKILPRPPEESDPDLYGAITAEAIGRVEAGRPNRRRAISTAVSSTLPHADESGSFGLPTSWSSALDAICVGRSFTPTPDGLTFLDFDEQPRGRLMVVSAGNVHRDDWNDEHLDRSDLEPVDDPGQAWNVLTVGAFTELTDPHPLQDHTPVAPAGELSPHSKTSVAFSRQWPPKPDVVLEGGNLAQSPSGGFDHPASMQLLTTWGKDGSRLLTVANGTSAATAQAARMAAQVWTSYPDLWPETVRALLAHGAQWTPAMQARFDGASTRTEIESLLRRYGMGVPTLERVLRSAENELVLVSEDAIRPFNDGRLREMHVYDLPWPIAELEALGETPVRLRVTLSYFIEPNPSRRGWAGRFRYASHGLRFDVKLPIESESGFRKRLNRDALAEDEGRPTGRSDADEWLLGPIVRHRGSVHTDIWSGTAADLAARGMLAVYPVTGWWKALPGRDRSDLGARYALVVSIEAPEVDVDLWTPVNTQVELPVPTEVTA